jgi:hypothetical protein
MTCEGEGEESRCVHIPYSRALGEECVNEAFDGATIGCNDPLTCEQDGDRRRCTQDCSVDNPCPEGFGCVDRPNTRNLSIGRCLPGVEDDLGLAPFENAGGDLANGDEMPGAGFSLPAGTEGGDGATQGELTNAESGTSCASSPHDRQSLPLVIWGSLLLFLLRTRRAPITMEA